MSIERSQDLACEVTRDFDANVQEPSQQPSREGRLGRAVFRLHRDENALVDLVRGLPAADRMTARIVLLRQLGPERGSAICKKAFPAGTGASPALPTTQRGTGEPGALQLLEIATAQGLAEVFAGLLRLRPPPHALLFQEALGCVEPGVARAALSVLRGLHGEDGGLTLPPTERWTRKASAVAPAAGRRAAAIYRRAVGPHQAEEPAHPAVLEALQQLGSGEPLPEPVQRRMEAKFGVSFARVRIHTDEVAQEAARVVHARAFTAGEDIFFAIGEFQPSSPDGLELLAHELTHVVQGYQGRIPSTVGTRVSLPGDALEREAEERSMSASSEADTTPGPAPRASGQQDAAARVAGAPALIARKPNDRTKTEPPVPTWTDLPDYVKTDLEPRQFDEKFFAAASPETRLTVLNLYVKLHGMGLWQYVGADDGTSGDKNPGSLTFKCTNVSGLKAALKARDDFNNPEGSMDVWSSREYRATGQLHFKHFKGWSPERVQAHIDRAGLFFRHPILTGIFTLGIATAVEAIRHGIDDAQDGYQGVYDIRRILLSQGWDPVPLLGINGRAAQ